ncbi:MAG: hypothetical protein AB7S26_29920 [Sandaracinaceae bacterium]
MSRRLAWLLAVSVLGCGAPSSPRAPDRVPDAPESPPEDGAEAEERDLVTLDAAWSTREDGVPEIAVDVAVDVGFVDPVPASVTLYFAEIELGDGDSSAVRFLTADAPASVDRDAGTLTAPVVDGVARARYRVALEHGRHDPVHGIDNAPHPTAGGWSVPGLVVFPSIARIDDGRSLDGIGVVRMRLPEGWSHHHSVGADDASRVEHFGELGQAIHTFGTYDVTRIERGASVVRVVSSDYRAAELAPLSSLITRTLDAGAELLGPLPPGALTIVMDRVGASYEGGLVGTTGIVLSGPDPGSLRAHEMPGLIVVHELMHLWSRGETPWLNEGLTRMLEIALGVILEDLGPDEAAAQLGERVERYYATAGTSRRVRGDEAGAWEYEGGLAVLLSVEGELRAAGTSILDVHRALREQHGLPVTVAALRDALDARVPGLGARLDGWLDHEGPLDLAAPLTALGFEAEATTARRLTPRALIVDVLGVRGLDTTRMTITAVRDGSALEVGDRVLEVNGQRARSLQEMAWALLDVRAGRPFDVVVQRGDGPARAVRMRMPRLGDDARDEVPRLRIGPGRAAGRLFDLPNE